MSSDAASGTPAGPTPVTEVTNRPDRLRYEITVDGELAGFAQYTDHRGVRTFVHTEIDRRFEGMGLASTLIADGARRRPDARDDDRAAVPVRARLRPPSRRGRRPARAGGHSHR